MVLAAMGPQLQELWELAKRGKVVVDETTQALLDQAEAQGIVGEDDDGCQQQMLAVLAEIQDLFANALPGAIDKTGKRRGA